MTITQHTLTPEDFQSFEDFRTMEPFEVIAEIETARGKGAKDALDAYGHARAVVQPESFAEDGFSFILEDEARQIIATATEWGTL